MKKDDLVFQGGFLQVLVNAEGEATEMQFVGQFRESIPGWPHKEARVQGRHRFANPGLQERVSTTLVSKLIPKAQADAFRRIMREVEPAEEAPEVVEE